MRKGRLALPAGRTCRTRSYRQISAALIPTVTPVVYIRFVPNLAKAEPSMKNGRKALPGHWRRFIVDVLIGVSTVAVAFAAIGAMEDVQFMLLICASVLLGIGLMLEPNVTAQPAGDIDPQSLRPSTEPNLRNPGSRQWGDGFDTAIVDATSV
jgi:hypothetical protein